MFAIRQGVLPVIEPEGRRYHELCEGSRAHRVKTLPGKLANLINSEKMSGPRCLLLHRNLDHMPSEVRARASGKNKMEAGVI